MVACVASDPFPLSLVRVRRWRPLGCASLTGLNLVFPFPETPSWSEELYIDEAEVDNAELETEFMTPELSEAPPCRGAANTL